MGYSPRTRKESDTTERLHFHFHGWVYSIVYMYHISFVCLSAGGHLGCLHVLTIVNSAAVLQGACMFLNEHFLQAYAQEWDCRMIW